jgi:tripartite-type tricarboxylate transporter receptor subunit TctC
MRRITRWAGSLAISAMSGLALSPAALSAEAWPQRMVRVIMPVGPGAGLDVTGRLFAERLADRWKRPVVIENRPGADGLIGTAAFIGMHDDHVLLFSPAAPISVYPFIYERLGYDPVHLVPIAGAADNFVAVSATASLGISSLGELVALARAQPGKLNYRTTPGAFPTFFAGFLKSTGLDMVQVSYREEGLAIQDLANGRFQVMLSGISNVLPQVQAGNVRLLAITNRARAPIAPEVPTAIEAGYSQLAFEGLMGFFGSRATSTELRNRISADVRAVAADPVLTSRLAGMGQIARGSTPEEFAAAVERQRAQMAGIVKLIGTKPTQ